jgi:hypothetical protein
MTYVSEVVEDDARIVCAGRRTGKTQYLVDRATSDPKHSSIYVKYPSQARLICDLLREKGYQVETLEEITVAMKCPHLINIVTPGQ